MFMKISLQYIVRTNTVLCIKLSIAHFTTCDSRTQLNLIYLFICICFNLNCFQVQEDDCSESIDRLSL